MQALVLVGGEGTRLRPLTATAPKPALALVDRPFMRYMIDWLARHGVDEVILACGFLPDKLEAALGHGEGGGPTIRYLAEPERRGTAGAIKFAEPYLEGRFLALNGDVLSDLDLSALIARHEAAGARSTLALYPVADPSAYGLVRRRDDGEIIEFLEKPDPDEIDTDEISAGAYVLERDVLDLIAPDREVSIEREVFPLLVGNGLYAERLEGYWMDIGTPERFLQASWDIIDGAVESEPGARARAASGVVIEPGAVVDPSAEISAPAYIGAGAELAAGVRLSNGAVVGAGSTVAAGASISGSILFDGCAIGPRCRVERSILAASVRIAEDAHIAEGSVLGEGALVSAGATPGPGARIESGVAA